MWQITDAVDTVICAPDDGWWYHPKHVVPDKINCVTLHLVGYILEYTLFCQAPDEHIMQERMTSITYCVIAVLTGGIQLLSVSQPSSSAVCKKETASENITRLILASLH